jgi:hypothetical protein
MLPVESLPRKPWSVLYSATLPYANASWWVCPTLMDCAVIS